MLPDNAPGTLPRKACSPSLRAARHLDGDDAEADVVIAPVRLEAQAERGPAGPAVIGPAPAAARARDIARAVPLCRRLRLVQVGVGAAGQLRMVPVAAP